MQLKQVQRDLNIHQKTAQEGCVDVCRICIVWQWFVDTTANIHNTSHRHVRYCWLSIKSPFWNLCFIDGNKKHEISEFPLPCLIPGGNRVRTPQLFTKVPGTVRPNPCIGRCPWRRRASPSTPQFLDKGWGSGGWWMKCSWILAVAGVFDFLWISMKFIEIWYSGLVYTIVTLMISDEFFGQPIFQAHSWRAPTKKTIGPDITSFRAPQRGSASQVANG